MTDPKENPAADADADLDVADADSDAIWAEMDAADNPQGVAAAAEGDKAAGEWAENAEPAPAEGEAQAEAGVEGEAKPEDAAEKTGEVEADPWANATPAQLAAWQQAQDAINKLEKYRQSHEGRIAAYQRQVDELKRAQAAAPQGRAADQAAAKPDGAAAEAHQEAQDAFASEGWKNLEEEYPEIAQAVRAIVDPLTKEVAPFKAHIAAVQEDRQRQEAERELHVLTERMPDWNETIVSNKPEFTRWINEQPRYVYEGFERNRNAIVDADEAADIIGRFKQHLTAGQNTQSPAPAGSPATQPLPDRRKRQMQSSASVQSKAPPVAVGIPDDPQGAWDAFERMGL